METIAKESEVSEEDPEDRWSPTQEWTRDQARDAEGKVSADRVADTLIGSLSATGKKVLTKGIDEAERRYEEAGGSTQQPRKRAATVLSCQQKDILKRALKDDQVKKQLLEGDPRREAEGNSVLDWEQEVDALGDKGAKREPLPEPQRKRPRQEEASSKQDGEKAEAERAQTLREQKAKIEEQLRALEKKDPPKAKANRKEGRKGSQVKPGGKPQGDPRQAAEASTSRKAKEAKEAGGTALRR